MIVIAGVALWQVVVWSKGPVRQYPNAREGFGVLAIFSFALYTAYSVVMGYFRAEEDSGRIAATIWIVVGIAPFVAEMVSPSEGGPTITIAAGIFTAVALCYRFQRRGWLL